jgi:DNA repair photolyase
MSVIYEPSGKAREYCELACNLYRGCEHNCQYCYAPACTYKTREDFSIALPRKNIIVQIKKEAPKHTGRKVLLCFTCDPYQPIEKEFEITKQTIQIFYSMGIIPVILTKGNLAKRDFDILKRSGAWYGATLTCLDDKESQKWESGAALPQERIEILRQAKNFGINTWVSLEPVLSPDVAMEIIQQTHTFVDIFKVGKWNYDQEANKIDWRKFVYNVVNLLEELHCKYYIKADLRKYRQEI